MGETAVASQPEVWAECTQLGAVAAILHFYVEVLDQLEDSCRFTAIVCHGAICQAGGGELRMRPGLHQRAPIYNGNLFKIFMCLLLFGERGVRVDVGQVASVKLPHTGTLRKLLRRTTQKEEKKRFGVPLATGDDDVLSAVHDGNEAVRIPRRHVTRHQPPVAKRPRLIGTGSTSVSGCS
eukprot:6964964-Pyramimonas_sp.AAC.1